jgi:hypothetical protein
MKGKVLPLVFGLGFVAAAGAFPGCECAQSNIRGNRDLGPGGGKLDLSMRLIADGPVGPDNDALNACGDFDPSCTVTSMGPTGNPGVPFPLPTDSPPPANVNADGVGRDPTGALILDSSHANFDFLWVADDVNYNVGLVSKINTKPRTAPAGAVNGKYAEVARYLTFTCYSSTNSADWPTAADRAAITVGTTHTSVCNGMTQGCCDNAPAGKRSALNILENRPSRTAVDFNGDLWVSNRAFSYQSSVTKIANKNDPNPTLSDCIDRNGNGKIDTSRDVNGDGIITTDCNHNNIPDDFADMINPSPSPNPSNRGPCVAGEVQEFYGLDDECILFTTNTASTVSGSNGWGRPLALGPGSNGDFGPSDAWAGHYNTGTFFRINGKTGYIQTVVKLPQLLSPIDNTTMVNSNPYGAVIDQFGILWAPNVDNFHIFYFDTTDPTNASKQGIVGAPKSLGNDGTGFYGVTLDGYQDPTTKQLVQQIWMAHWGGSGGAFRYRPKRTTNFSDLKSGTWAYITAPSVVGNGRGIAADNRSPARIWVGIDSNPGRVGRIDDNIGDGAQLSMMSTFSAGAFAGVTTLGVGVANDLDIWGVNQGDSSLTHYTVAAGNNDLTPADKVTLDDNPRIADGIKPHPYTYSDFTGFGLRNFTNPHGSYQWKEVGCGMGAMGKTKWLKIVWDADTPTGTAVQVKARATDDPTMYNAATWTSSYTTSPADLSQGMPALAPNPSGFLQVEFDLTTSVKDATPRLKSFQIIYECLNGVS